MTSMDVIDIQRMLSVVNAVIREPGNGPRMVVTRKEDIKLGELKEVCEIALRAKTLEAAMLKADRYFALNAPSLALEVITDTISEGRSNENP